MSEQNQGNSDLVLDEKYGSTDDNKDSAEALVKGRRCCPCKCNRPPPIGLVCKTFKDDVIKEFGHDNYKMQMTSKQMNEFGRSVYKGTNEYTFLIWRAAAAVIVWFIFLQSFFIDEARNLLPWWPIYLTHWSLTLQTIYHTLAFFVTYKHGLGKYSLHTELIESKERMEPPRLIWWTWLLQNIVYPLSLYVAVLFWAGVQAYLPTSFLAHGVNAGLMLLDIGVADSPFRLAHMYQSAILAFVYGIWTIIHAYAKVDNGWLDGRYIYPFTNYDEDPRAWIYLTLVIVVGIPFFYSIAWFVNWLVDAHGVWTTWLEEKENTALTWAKHHIEDTQQPQPAEKYREPTKNDENSTVSNV